MIDWRRVIAFEDCPEGASEHVVDGRMVALFRVGDQVHALDGVCPHQGGPLGQGTLSHAPTADNEGTCFVTCPWHGWQFDIQDGRHRTSPLQQPAFPTKVEEGDVYVAWDSAQPEIKDD